MLNVLEGYFERKTSGAAGYDILTSETVNLPAHTITKVGTGTRVQLPPNTDGSISTRGSVPSKMQLVVELGVFDSDYTGELFLNVHNVSGQSIYLPKGSRIAQCVIRPIWENPIKATGERGESGTS